MAAIASGDSRDIAPSGHRGAGKTSLAEAMLSVARATPKLGEVDDETSLLDDLAEEKEHACSLEASVSLLLWNGPKVNLVIDAFVPLAEILEYESKLESMTQGKGTLSRAVDHREICPPNAREKVIKESGFKADDDDE